MLRIYVVFLCVLFDNQAGNSILHVKEKKIALLFDRNARQRLKNIERKRVREKQWARASVLCNEYNGLIKHVVLHHYANWLTSWAHVRCMSQNLYLCRYSIMYAHKLRRNSKQHNVNMREDTTFRHIKCMDQFHEPITKIPPKENRQQLQQKEKQEFEII